MLCRRIWTAFDHDGKSAAVHFLRHEAFDATDGAEIESIRLCSPGG